MPNRRMQSTDVASESSKSEAAALPQLNLSKQISFKCRIHFLERTALTSTLRQEKTSIRSGEINKVSVCPYIILKF